MNVERDAYIATAARLRDELAVCEAERDRAVELLRELLKAGAHEGECRNIADDPSTGGEGYNQWDDACERHILAAKARADAACAFLASVATEESNE